MSVNIQQKEINIKDYIEDWLKEVESKERIKKNTLSTNVENGKDINEKNTHEKSSSTLSVTNSTDDNTNTTSTSKENKLEKPGRLDTIAKRFQKLRFDEKWNTKLLTDNFVLLGTTGKNSERYLTLEMALFNAGYRIREGGLKKKIRKYIKDLTEWEFLQLLDEYRGLKTSGKFTGRWNPFGIRNKNEFLREFRSPHFTVEDDPIMISLVSQITNLDFVIFHENYTIQDLRGQNDRKFIILYKFTEKNPSNTSYSTYMCCVGLNKKKHNNNIKHKKSNNNNLIYKFDNEHIPEEISILLNRDEFVFRHISNLIETKLNKNECLKLDKIIDELEKTVCSHFSHSEIRGIVKIINTILLDRKFFC